MTTNELREAFQAFFEERGHLRVPPHSLIPPADDQTTLFIVAGMQQFKPYFLRTKEPPSNRVVSVQPCLRAGGKDTDLEDVGRTDRHNSFFEMMGNFSFGDYFKDEAVDYAYEWVTQVLGLDPQQLWATVHEGDPVLSLDEDTVAIEAWKRVGIPEERIVRLGKDNFWQAAEVGPCGQCSEIFYDRGEARACGDPDCGPGHCDRYMEIYNLVFMEYDLQPGNVLERLPNQNVDTGMGVERTAMVLQDVDSNFDTDGFRVIMDWVERESGVGYHDNDVATRAHRVIADHGRAVSFLIAEGVVPSNEGRGYICRRLLRRAIQHANRIGLDRIYRLPAVVIEQMGEAYPHLREQAGEIERVVRQEEERFSETLARGLKVFDELADKPAISADDAFTLVATYGFPIELTQELAEERGQPVDVDGFRLLMEGHREVSRGGGENTTQQAAAQLVEAGRRVERVRRLLEDVGADGGRRGCAGGRHTAVRQARAVTVLRGERRPGQRHRHHRRRRRRAPPAGRRRPEVRRRPGARRRARRARAARRRTRASRRSSTGATASRRRRTTRRRTCSTPRCARCSVTTSSRRAPRCAPTSCASTSHTPSR